MEIDLDERSSTGLLPVDALSSKKLILIVLRMSNHSITPTDSPNDSGENSRLEPPTGTLRFTNLKLTNWKNFSSVDVKLQRRIFIVGPNASGKSNFLDVFRFLHDIVAVGRGLEQAIALRGGVSSLRALSARRYSDISIDVQIGRESEQVGWNYKLTFNQDNNQRPLIKKEEVWLGSQCLLSRPNADDESDRERLTQTYLQQVNVNKPFRGIADFFSEVKYLHIVPQLVREPDRSVGKRDDPFGGDFIEQVARTSDRTRTVRLRQISSALKVAVPQLESLTLSRDPVRGTPHFVGRYKHWRPQGAFQTEDQFSDGTLRLLGLLWAVLDGSGLLLLEEPELSLHTEVVRFLPQMFARIQRKNGRQIFASTHSPDLLREGVGANEVLLLEPGNEGTLVSPAGALADVSHLLNGGIPLPEIVLPKTRPDNAGQLALFSELD